MSETIGIIGLGRMGIPAAKKYINEGYKVVGYARRPEVIEEFRSFGGIAVENSKEVAQKAGKVIVYVLNDQQVIDVVTGPNGILEGCHKDTRVINMATIDRENLEWVAEQCAKKQVGLVDSPVTGGPARVEASSWWTNPVGPRRWISTPAALPRFADSRNPSGPNREMTP